MVLQIGGEKMTEGIHNIDEYRTKTLDDLFAALEEAVRNADSK